MSRKIEPTGNRILIMVKDYEPYTESKILITGNRPKENRGIILRIGPDVTNSKLRPMTTVFYNKAGISLTSDRGTNFMMIEESAVWGVEDQSETKNPTPTELATSEEFI